jgi:Tfp pilus assembly protein PilX
MTMVRPIARPSTGSPRSQRGATLIMGLIMLVLLTLMGLASINSATSNLKVVGNMQYQQEALGAAQVAINQVLSKGSYFSDPTTSPASATVDINGDGVADYTVTLAQPCILLTKDILQGPGSELVTTIAEDLKCISSSVLRNPGIMGQNTGATKSDCAWVTWRITASVNDTGTKAKVSLVQAARQRMDRIVADAFKSDAAKRCS